VPGRIVVLAQDLIWQDRLAGAVTAAGFEPIRVGTAAAFERALADADAAVIDVTTHAYDPFAAVAGAAAAGLRVLVVAPHDDVDLRKRALASGADKVLAYRKLFEDGPATIAAWMGQPAGAR
jgi:hypothetical protein